MVSTRRILAAACLSALLASTGFANQVFEKGARGNPKIGRIDVLSFTSDGVLLIGDGGGSQIVAIDTKDKSKATPFRTSIDDIQAKIAARMGTTAKGIQIVDLAVNPASGRVYLGVYKRDDRSSVILTIDGSGKIDEFELDNVEYARIQLNGEKVKISRVTDVAYADGKIIAAGRGNETFASKIFTVLTPVKNNQSGTIVSAQTYHVQHGRWETKAPMSVLIPYKENGKSYIVGAFSCTPIVKYPVDAITSGAKVTGSSVLELGSGNRPIDMFIYKKNGKSFVLANTNRFHHKRRPISPSPYWTVKFEQSILSEKKAVNKEALRRVGRDLKPITERVQMVESFHGVAQMDQLDAERAIVLRETKNGLRLEAIALP